MSDDDERIQVRGSMDITVRFRVNDLVKLIEKYPKDWLALTTEELQRKGGFAEWERLVVFLDGYLDSLGVITGFGDEFTTLDVDWDDTDFPWDEDKALALDQALPQHLRFLDHGPQADPALMPGPNDLPLPGLEA